MTERLQQFQAIEAHTSNTVVAMLDALLDASAAAQGGFSAARYATDLRRLGDNLALAATEIGQILSDVAEPHPARVAAA